MRPPRISYAGGVYHVTIRCNNREFNFKGDEDFALYIRILLEAKAKYEVKIYAFCLHFVIFPDFGLFLALISNLIPIFSKFYLRFPHKIFFVVAFDHLTSSFCRSSSPVFSSVRLNRLFCRLLRVAGTSILFVYPSVPSTRLTRRSRINFLNFIEGFPEYLIGAFSSRTKGLIRNFMSLYFLPLYVTICPRLRRIWSISCLWV